MAKAKGKGSRKKAAKPARKSAKKVRATRVKKAAPKKAVKKTARKAARKVTARAVKKVAKKAAKKVARKPARPAAKAAKPASPAKPARPPVRVPVKAPPAAPAQVPAAPVIDVEPALPRPTAPQSAKPLERGPRFYEPDEQPTAAGPAGAGPFYEDDRRDRPFYDTEERKEEEVEPEVPEVETGEEELEEEGEPEAEDDDEDDARPLRSRPPPQRTAHGATAPEAAPGPVDVGSTAPAFELPDERGRLHSLAQYRGRKVVLYFYPKDDTPGCTREACGFRDVLGEFDDRGTVVLGVSPDSVASHAAFARKYSLTFPVLADEGQQVARQYGVWGEKPGPGGTKRMGIQRTTFIIDEAGRVAKVFRNVQPDGHEHQIVSWLDQNWLASG